MSEQLYRFKCKPSRAIKALDAIRMEAEGILPEWLQKAKAEGQIIWNKGEKEVFVWCRYGECFLSTEEDGWIVEIHAPEWASTQTWVAPYRDSLFKEKLEPVPQE